VTRIVRRRARRARGTFSCPACGDQVPEGSLACRSCGSDDRTGWRRDDDEDFERPGEDLDDEDYRDVVADLEERAPRSSVPRRTRIVAAILVIVLVALVFSVLLW
jgi:uncharacterized membrane protein YvbJ